MVAEGQGDAEEESKAHGGGGGTRRRVPGVGASRCEEESCSPIKVLPSGALIFFGDPTRLRRILPFLGPS